MDLQIPPGDFAAFIFDLDGTLVDSMPLHHRAWDRVLREHGVNKGMDAALFHSLSGAAPLEFTAALARHTGRELDGPALLEAKNAAFEALQTQIEVIPATVEMARLAAGTHRLAVASGGARQVVLALLNAAGLRELFPVVVGGDEVAHGKPAPDLFLEAARRLGVPPAECLVFEDAAPGLMAAEAAGMKWVRVFPPRPRHA